MLFLLVKMIEKVVVYMQIAAQTSLNDFANSNVSKCFVPAAKADEYYVTMHADDPERPAYMVGSVGDPHGTPEFFRLLLPTPLAVGNRGTIINLTSSAIKSRFPVFVAKQVNVDGYNVISPHFGAPSFRVGRLVAIAWLPKPAGAMEVDHLDGNPANDNLDNLEWVSHGTNLKRGRHSTHHHWADSDYVLMVREGDIPKLVHPSKVASVTGSSNQSHIFRRKTRRSANGWYLAVNPTRADALNFVDDLPFEDTSPYAAAVEELFEELGID